MLKSITWTFNQWSKTADEEERNHFEMFCFAPVWRLYLCLPFCVFVLLDTWLLVQTFPDCQSMQCGASICFPQEAVAERRCRRGFCRELLWINSLNFFFFFLCKHAAEDPVSSVGCCPHRSNNHQQPTAGLFILPFPVLAILGKPPFFWPIYRGDASMSWCCFILKLFIVPLFKYKSIMC